MSRGEGIQIGGFGIRYLVEGEETGGAYALLEHTLQPGVMAAPPHRHAREDELSYVLEGTLTVWEEAPPGRIVPASS